MRSGASQLILTRTTHALDSRPTPPSCGRSPWLTREHPDPDCWHLEVLCRLLVLFTESYGDAAVFIDFCSLYQWPRDDEQEALFQTSLKGLKQLYAHQTTWVWALNVLPPGSTVRPYELRGWPAYEMAVSSWIKDPLKLLDISLLGTPLVDNLDACTSWHEAVHQRCVATRQQPLSPAAFDALLGRKVFSNGADQDVVSTLYADVFFEVFSQVRYLPPSPAPPSMAFSHSAMTSRHLPPSMAFSHSTAFSQVRELDYSGLGWTDVDALIDALSTTSDGKDHRPQAGEKACRKLQYLWLFDNPICDPEKALVRLKGALGEECEICGLSAA